MHDNLMYELEARMDAAQKRYGPFASTHEALGVAIEEWDELRGAIHGNYLQAIEDECLDLAAVLMRLARMCLNASAGGADLFADRSVK